MIIANAAGSILGVNSQAESLFGYSRTELLGSPVEMLLPAHFRPEHVARRTEYVGAPRVRPMGAGMELVALRKDGTEFPVEISLSPLKTAEEVLVCASIRDVTDRRDLIHALRENNLQLAKANAAKDTFLEGMSDELRTPLNAVIGFTGTLLMKLPGPLNLEQESQLRSVQGSARHMLSLVADLLDLTKIESGGVEIENEIVDCREVMKEVAEWLQPLAGARGLKLSVAGGEGEPLEVNGERRAIRQILVTLASKAITQIKSGNVVLAVHRRDDGGKTWADISINTNGGRGTPPVEETLSLNPFSDGRNVSLYLSKRLAELLGGSIQFHSDSDKTAMSVFTLPVHE